MPEMQEQFALETIEEILRDLPVEMRLKGLSVDELLAAMSPETRAALAQLLKENGSQPIADAGGPKPGDAKP